MKIKAYARTMNILLHVVAPYPTVFSDVPENKNGKLLPSVNMLCVKIVQTSFPSDNDVSLYHYI